jgi:uncharacterized protein (TIGR03435 family)
MAAALAVFLGLLLASAVPAQDAAARAQFEVASIKPSREAARGSTFYNPTRDRFQFDNVTVKALIAYAYAVPDTQIVGASGWVATGGYDVLAKPEGDVTDERIRGMVQSLLAERLSLKVHQETKEMPVYALVTAKGGAKLTKSPMPDQPTAHGGFGRMSGRHLTVDNLSSLLAARVERPVIDKTGIEGQYDIDLHWTPEESPEPGPSIFSALQEQLGLRLESQRAAQDIVVIDHVERPSEN